MVWEVPLGEVVGIVPLEDDGCVTGDPVVTVPLAVVCTADVVVMLTEAVVGLMEAVVTSREAVVPTNVVLPSCEGETVVTLLETVVEALPSVVAKEVAVEALPSVVAKEAAVEALPSVVATEAAVEALPSVVATETLVEALPSVVAEEAVLEASLPTAEPRRHTHSTATMTCFIVISAPFLLLFLVLFFLQFHSLATTLPTMRKLLELRWS